MSSSTSNLNSPDIAISVRSVSKAYRIWRDPSARLKAPLVEAWQKLRAKSYELLAKTLNLKAKSSDEIAPSSKLPAPSSSPYYKDFYALKDVSFEVKKGEAIGIIGRNGSGKSTLLQLIAGTLTPTSGNIKVNGRVAALLELGSGFNPDFTGRENIYLNASVLGLTKGEIDERYDAIVSFADIGDFIEQPVKTYSSGMLMRLAFSVQTAVNPEILIIDEALGVGDFFFVQKCFKRIRGLISGGTTLLFVSHDMGMVRDLCASVVFFNNGRIIFNGDCKTAINRFQDVDGTNQAVWMENKEFEKEAVKIKESAFEKKIKDIRPAILDSIGIFDIQKRKNNRFLVGEKVFFRVEFIARIRANYTVSIAIKNKFDQLVTSNGCQTLGIEPCTIDKGQKGVFELGLAANFEAGLYSIKVFLGTPSNRPNQGNTIDESDWLNPFEVFWDYNQSPAPFLGMFGPPAEGRFLKN